DPLDDGDGGPDGDDPKGDLEDEEVPGDARDDEAETQDDEPDLPGHDADGGHPRPGRESEAFALGAGVADHEGHAHGGRPQDDHGVRAARGGPRATDDDADVDDHLAPAIEDRVHEGPERADLAGRPRERAIEHVERAADEDDDPADEPLLGPDEDGAGDRDPEADQGQAIRGEAEAAHAEGDRLEDRLDARAGLVREGHRTSLRARGRRVDGRRTPRTPPRAGGRSSRGPAGGSRPPPARAGGARGPSPRGRGTPRGRPRP